MLRCINKKSLLGFCKARIHMPCVQEWGVVAYHLNLAMIEYKTLVIRGDLAAAQETIGRIPKDQLNNVARFLEGRGLPEDALQVCP